MLARIRQFVLALHHDTAGAMAVEKVLLLALISLPIVVILAIFGKKIMGWFGNWDTKVESEYAPPP